MTESNPPAERYYQAALLALQQQDRTRARAQLVEAVRLDPLHAGSWRALIKLCPDPEEQLFCLQQLGRISPTDPRLRQAYQRFRLQNPAAESRPLRELVQRPRARTSQQATVHTPAVMPSDPLADDALETIDSDPPASSRPPLTPPVDPLRDRSKLRNPLAARREDRRAAGLLVIASQKRDNGDLPGALEVYRDILHGDPAHAEALAEAVRILSRQRRLSEARDWVAYAIKAGNRDPAAYVSLAELRLLQGGGDPWEPLVALCRLPDLKPHHLLGAAAVYWKHGRLRESLETLHAAEKRAPADPSVLMRLAKAYEELGYQDRSEGYLKRIVDQGTRSAVGQEAEHLLLERHPHIPRYVQVSMLYALREVLGIVLFFGLIAMLDAGVSVTGIGPAGWGGVLLSLIGGYLLVSATSSPAQNVFQRFLTQPLARPPRPGDQDFLPSGQVVEEVPTLSVEVRYVLGTIGAVLLIVAVVLVLRNSLVATQQTLRTVSSGRIPDFVLEIFDVLIGGF